MKEGEESKEVEENPARGKNSSTGFKASLVAEVANVAQACPLVGVVVQLLLVHLGGAETVLKVHPANCGACQTAVSGV